MPISAKESINKLNKDISNCKKCADLIKTRKQPIPGTGAPKAKIMVICNYPGAIGTEKKDIPFSGDDRSKFIRKIFNETGLSLARDTYITYLVKCSSGRPVKKEDGSAADNIESSKKHINNCISFLTREISIITPHIIVSLGLNVSNIILQKYFSVNKKYRSMEKIHMRIFENPSFKLVPFSDPLDVIISGTITEERYRKDFESLSKFLKII